MIGVIIINENDICNLIDSVLQSKYGIEPVHLDNCTEQAQMPLPEEGEQTMAKGQRMRMCIGYNDDGSMIEKMISGNSQYELADRIVLAMLKSERRDEFLAKCGITVGRLTEQKSAPTFREYVDSWLKLYKIDKLKPKTLKGYQDKLKIHLFPSLGNIPLSEITTESIQELLNAQKDYSHKSLQEVLTLLRQILNSAVSDQIISRNPAADKRIYNPSTARHERTALSLGDCRDVVNNLDKLEGFDR